MYKNIVFFLIFFTLSTFSVFSVGIFDKCKLTIENNTGSTITQIIVSELETNKLEEKTLNRNMQNGETTEITIRRKVQYGIVLISSDDRQFAQRRQAWDTETARLTFTRRHHQDRNIWDKVRRVFLWPDYL